MGLAVSLQKFNNVLDNLETVKTFGRVTQVVGLVIEGSGPVSSLGDNCMIQTTEDGVIKTVVVGFRKSRILLMPLGNTRGIAPGNRIVRIGSKNTIKVGNDFLGRVIDGLGKPMDGMPEPKGSLECPIFPEPINPLLRKRITQPLILGVKAVDGLLTVGKGQRIGIFAGSGVGKSVMLGMMAKNTEADVNVIALIGERGREVREFLERDLGKKGLKRSVVVVATSDQPPLVRRRALYIAMSIAEYFRGCGKDVLLMVDSITRFAMSQREIGLAIGEPPSVKGYTPSVFAELPQVLERAGNSSGDGSITGIYTVLVEGDDMNDPIADAARSILDGHIVLSRDIAAGGRYPAIDILNSISRLMIELASDEHLRLSRMFIDIAAIYQEVKDLINIGAYKKGSNVKIDFSIDMRDKMENFLKQKIDSNYSLKETVGALSELFQQRGGL